MCYGVTYFYFSLIKYLHGIKETREDILCDKVIQPETPDAQKTNDGINTLDNCKHLIDCGDQTRELTMQRETRISLTIRHVPKTKKIKIKL